MIKGKGNYSLVHAYFLEGAGRHSPYHTFHFHQERKGEKNSQEGAVYTEET